MSNLALIITDIGIIVGALIPFVIVAVCLINGMKCLLRTDMLSIYYRHRDTGIIRQYELENFVLLYKAYKALKGNSFIDKIYKDVMTWSVVT